MKEESKKPKAESQKLEAESVEQETVSAEAVVAEEPTKEIKATAKAGKRSSKSIKEAEEKATKEAKKAEAKTDEPKAKPVIKTRSRLERASKKYREVTKLIDKTISYTLGEALELATKTSTTKFDATIELHINLNVDPKQADQNVRDTLTLPAGTGKTMRVAAFVEADDTAKAKTAGADIVGADSIIALLDKEQLDFDVMVSTPALMPKLGKYARLLGPRGLMPSPKSGTVTADVETAIKESKMGKVEYRVDQAGIIHLGIGKVSFGADKLSQNAKAVIASVKAAKPSSVKTNYVKNVTVATTMGPSIKVDITSLS